MHADQRFPIESQTSPADKDFLLKALELIGNMRGKYTYVEIGSFMGGSLTPFLIDAKCTLVLSIDERERQQDDERGAKFDYAGITAKTMIANLHKHGIRTEKLQTFDGSVDALQAPPDFFDLGFIDAEHTDVACFRDYLWLMPIMKKDSVLMFHDSELVHKALRIIQLHLRKSGLPFRFFKKTNSAMSAILLGDYARMDPSAVFGAEESPDAFYAAAETEVINHLVANRVTVNFSTTVTPPKTLRAY